MRNKRFATVLPCIVLCLAMVLPAAAVQPQLVPGWDAWNAMDYGSHITMTCPEKNVDADAILSAVCGRARRPSPMYPGLPGSQSVLRAEAIMSLAKILRL